MVRDYMDAMALRKLRPDYAVEDIVGQHCSHVRWDRELKNNLRRGKRTSYSANRIRTTQYRPFVRSHCYVDYVLANNKYQQDRIFPLGDHPNRAIYVPGTGSVKGFSALVVDRMPDLQVRVFRPVLPPMALRTAER